MNLRQALERRRKSEQAMPAMRLVVGTCAFDARARQPSPQSTEPVGPPLATRTGGVHHATFAAPRVASTGTGAQNADKPVSFLPMINF